MRFETRGYMSAEKGPQDASKTLRDRKSESEVSNHAPAAKPVSLAPLSYEEAMRGLVGVKLEKPSDDPR